MSILERRRDKIVHNYNIIADKILTDNSHLSEQERVKIHDDIGNKVTEICGFIFFIDRNNPECEYKQKIIFHEEYVLSVMSDIKNQFSDLLKEMDLDFFKFKTLEDISVNYFNEVGIISKKSFNKSESEIDLFLDSGAA